MFTICVIGCGGISVTSHGPSYVKYQEKHPEVVLGGCCDLDEERARRYQEQFGFRNHYTDFHQMITAEKPDAICVIVTEAAAARVGIAVLGYRIPMLIEKPPGKNSEETKALIAAAREAGVPHMVAFNRHFIPLMQACKKEMAQIDTPLLTVQYEFCRHGRNDPDFSDTAVHAIDAVRFLADSDYRHVNFTYQKVSGAADSVYLSAEMKNGAMAQLQVLPGCGVVLERATVHYRDYTLFLHMPIWGDGYDIPGSLTVLHKGNVLKQISGAALCNPENTFETNGFYGENEIFFDSVRNGLPLESTLPRALQTIYVKEAYARGDMNWQAE